ncbi:MAG: PqqD family protein [Eubacteriales bacterium]
MRATKDVMLRQIAGENVLFPVGAMAEKLFGLMALNESGVLLWQKLAKDCTEDDLVELLLSEYNVDRETAQADVRQFLTQLADVGILEDTTAPNG